MIIRPYSQQAYRSASQRQSNQCKTPRQDQEHPRLPRPRPRPRGDTREQIAAALGCSQRSIQSYLASPWSTVQAERQRIAQPRPQPKPKLHIPAAAICCLLVPPTKEIAERDPKDSKLRPHEEIDVLAELTKHWERQDRQKSHIPHKKHNPPPAKPPPDTKIADAP